MAEVDRISFLPEEIKISILSCLQVKDAIRTSTLARSWRHVYTLLPSLRLGCFRDRDRLGDTSKDFDSCPVSSSWMQRVNHVVSSLQGPFLDFQLSLHADFIPSSLLQSLLDLLFQKGGVQMLHLHCHYSFHSHKVIVRLPPFHSLKVLRLSGCQLILPKKFRGFHFHCLTTLSLYNVLISNHHLQLLLDTSKNLTTLMFYARDLDDLAPDISLNISFLPFLTYAQFGINVMVDKICLVSTPRLEEAHITVNSYVSEKLARVTLGLLTGVSMVSSLHLDCGVLKALSLLALPFSFSFPQLKCLMFFLNVASMDQRTRDVLHWLLKSMPFLEELDVKLLSFTKQTEGVATLMRELLVTKQNGVPCLDQTLKSVTIHLNLLKEVMTGISVVKFFLLNAKVLKLLKILYYDNELSLVEELQKVEVASLDAKVVMFNTKTKVTVNVK
ncbi:F-box family protein [Rhynchospora pubera]|uniref:F-box family protein n=1 Tax=Rhynchospora pubera TaxID=906938 RepID=A0AAV8GFJ8_9POAL|nr:F-box family protein [Rhynchospora pubera]